MILKTIPNFFRAAILVMDRFNPSNSMVPAARAKYRRQHLDRGRLPAPFGPRKAKILSWATSKEMPSQRKRIEGLRRLSRES